jgi:hypothetical protein
MQQFFFSKQKQLRFKKHWIKVVSGLKKVYDGI